MKMQLIRGIAVAACTVLFLSGVTGIAAHENEREHVILLHGLAMSSMIMIPLGLYLEDQGYVVHNINYPSTSRTVESISSGYIRPVVESIRHQGGGNIHIVTHSMGGIVARYYLSMYSASPVTSMVMIAPPNRGSTMAEVLKKYKVARWFFGPALAQLSTGSGSIVHMLNPLSIPTGVIAGCASMNPVNSLILPGDDDGTVAVSHTAAEGMHDFVVIPRSHSGILFDRKVYELVVRFLREGSF